MAAETFRGAWKHSDSAFKGNGSFMIMMCALVLVLRWDDPDVRIRWLVLGALAIMVFFTAPWIHTLTITDEYLTWRVGGIRLGHARWDQVRSLSLGWSYVMLAGRRTPVWYSGWGHIYATKTPGLADAILVQLQRHPRVEANDWVRRRLVRATWAEHLNQLGAPLRGETRDEKPPGARWDLPPALQDDDRR